MAFREVWVVQIRELLRRWLAGNGEHTATRTAGVARRTARNYIAAAIALGVDRPASQSKLTDALIGEICEQVRLGGPDGHGESWRAVSRARADPHLGEPGPHGGESKHPARAHGRQRPEARGRTIRRRALRGEPRAHHSAHSATSSGKASLSRAATRW